MYTIRIDCSNKGRDEIMEEMEQALEKISECWKRPESLGAAVVRESDFPKEEPDSNDTPEMEELIEKIKSGEKIPISIQSEGKAPELKLCKAVNRERKRNHLTITIEAEEPAEAKVLFKNLRKAIRKEKRLLLGNISYEIDCKVRKNDTSLNTYRKGKKHENRKGHKEKG